jgi:beta-1,4-N-acetylglucosaminyltransferase
LKANEAADVVFALTAATTLPRERAYLVRTPRSREVKQSYVSSVWTTLVALAAACAIAWREQPQLLLVNGPGTCLPLCVVVCALSALRLAPACDIVFVESVARVHKLSLTGLILYKLGVCTQFIVQWEELRQRYPDSTQLKIFF